MKLTQFLRILLVAIVGATGPIDAADWHWEQAIRTFEAADKTNPPPTNAVVFIGSSTIVKWKTLADDFPEILVIRRGFGGSEIADSAHYANRIVVPYKPKLVVLYAGGNDLHNGKSPAHVLADFQTFVATIHTALPQTPIVYLSVNPSTQRLAELPKIRELNRLIAEYSNGHPFLTFIDSHTKLLGLTGLPRPEILADGLHLNSQGYRELVAIVKPQILALAGIPHHGN